MNQPAAPPPIQRRRRGCLLSGCMVLVVLFLFSLVGLLVGYRMVMHRFTSKTALSFPAPQLSEAQAQEVHRRVTMFRDAVRSAQPTPPLALTAEEMNSALVTEPEMQPYTNMLHIDRIDPQGIVAEVSVPVDKLPMRLPMTAGRYINGTARFTLSLTNGTLVIRAQELSVGGRSFPEHYMEKLKSMNLASDINNNPRSSPGLNRVQSIGTKDDKLVITAQPAE